MVGRVTRLVQVYPDPATAASAAAARLVSCGEAAVARSGSFAVAVSGGRTPEPLYRALARRGDGPRVWRDWHLFLCDERLVPGDSPLSNLGMVRRSWLGPARFPAENVHPVETSLDAETSAARYDEVLHRWFGSRGGMTFDAVVLGVGPDGHTASLFPGSPSLDIVDRWVVGETRPALPPPVPRVTLTLTGLGRSRMAIFFVTGAEKREALGKILGAPAPVERMPAARVTAQESVEWFLDASAAPASS